jgi:hypothetical protein
VVVQEHLGSESELIDRHRVHRPRVAPGGH